MNSNIKYEENRIYLENKEGRVIAEVTFPQSNDNTVNIDHTFVDSSLRGQGIAENLMEEAVKTIQNSGRKAISTCSYAEKWFEKHPEYKDILA